MIVEYEDYSKYKNTVINRIESILIEKSDVASDEFRAFLFFTADLFAGSTDEESFFVTESKDQGIDFYTEADRNYEVFQCKFAELGNLIRTQTPLKFDDDCVRDIENAYKYVLSGSSPSTANPKVKALRSEIVTEGYEEISFNLCIFGELTEDAKQKYDILKKKYEDDKVKFNIYTWTDIVEQILFRSRPPEDIKFRFKVADKQVLSRNDYCYFLAYAKDFYTLFKQYGWALFDLNVRYELRNSSINKNIVESLTHTKSMKFFHHLNNGILIFCDSYSKKDNDESIEIKKLQIINGCQTVLSIKKAFDEINNDREKVDAFNNKCYVQLKIIKNAHNLSELIDEIVVSTNNQNPMSKRNLKSNSEEQKAIRVKFENFYYKWFYQRKDGEFESLRSKIAHNGFRISDFKKDNIYRYLDNNDLAKSWISFIGFSNEAIQNTDYFNNRKIYNSIFKSYPSEKMWGDFSNPERILDMDSDEYFEHDKRPSAEEYLLSYLIWKFVKEYAPTTLANKALALERGVCEGLLKRSSTGKITDPPEKQAEYLINDTEYMVNNIINNSKEVLVEMFSFILVRKYGYGFDIARKILKTASFSTLVQKPDLKAFITDIGNKRDSKDVSIKDNLLFCIYEFLKYAIGQLYFDIKSDYIAAPRRKTYLASQKYTQKLKKKILEINDSPDFPAQLKDFKKPNKNIFDSLPNIE
jgi:hypothetical protein